MSTMGSSGPGQWSHTWGPFFLFIKKKKFMYNVLLINLNIKDQKKKKKKKSLVWNFYNVKKPRIEIKSRVFYEKLVKPLQSMKLFTHAFQTNTYMYACIKVVRVWFNSILILKLDLPLQQNIPIPSLKKHYMLKEKNWNCTWRGPEAWYSCMTQLVCKPLGPVW